MIVKNKTKVLMVCLGNICRSPTAEAVLKKMAREMASELTKDQTDFNLDIEVDSAGTASYHVGERSDPRSIRHATQRGYSMNHRARVLCVDDFETFDWIFAMDDSNYQNILKLCPNERLKNKVKKISDYDPQGKIKQIPDPYYGETADFENVIDLLEVCVKGFIRKLYATTDQFRY